jgi:nucleoid-associated protein YgaU
MMPRRSRYDAARWFDPPPPGVAEMMRPRDIEPTEGIVEHTVTAGDRLDLLAQEYYGDARAWWRILDANPQLLDAGDLQDPSMEGHVIVIPRGDL